MIHLLFLSLIITIFEISPSSFSNETFSPPQRNLGTLRLTPNASIDSGQASPIFSDRTHRPNNNSLESSPVQNLLSPLLLKKHHASLSHDSFSKENYSIKIPNEDLNLKNSIKDNDGNSIYKSLSSKINNTCSETICGYNRNKVIIASISLTVFTSGILCLLLIKDK